MWGMAIDMRLTLLKVDGWQAEAVADTNTIRDKTIPLINMPGERPSRKVPRVCWHGTYRGVPPVVPVPDPSVLSVQRQYLYRTFM